MEMLKHLGMVDMMVCYDDDDDGHDAAEEMVEVT